jgi:hypothetical protein
MNFPLIANVVVFAVLLNRIFQNLAVGAVNQLQAETKDNADNETDQYFLTNPGNKISGERG